MRESEKGQTGGEEDEVDGSVDAGHGDDVLFGGGEGLPDPGEGVPGPGRPALPRIQTFQDPIRVVHHVVAWPPREPGEEAHQNHENRERRSQRRQERREIHLPPPRTLLLFWQTTMEK